MGKLKDALQALSKPETWKSKKVLWIGIPVLIWIIGMASYWYITTSVKAKRQIKGLSVASNLQEDINFISTKAQSAQILPSLNKEDLLKSDKEDNFLEQKIRKNLERADYAKSEGTKDDIPLQFDTALNASIHKEAVDNLAAGGDSPIQELKQQARISSMPDTALANVEIQQALNKIRSGANPRSIGRNSSYEHLEQDRKARLAAGKADNRRRREALEHSTLEEEVAAYRRGLEDQERRYAALEGDPDYSVAQNGTSSSNHYRRTSSKGHSKTKKQKLQFDTNMGVVNELHVENKAALNQRNNTYTTPLSSQALSLNAYDPLHQSNEAPQVLPATYKPTNQPLYAIIDRAQKLRSGDKVRLRLLESGIYKRQLLPKNQILYGICSVAAGRIKIRVSSINLQQQLIAAGLEVYDLDGMQGIYVEGADINIGQEALREGLREASGLGLRHPLGNLSLRLGRKASKNSTASIPAGYQVLLFDQSL